MLKSYKQYFKIEFILLFLWSFEFLGKTNYIGLLLFLYLTKYKNNLSLFNSYLPCIILFSISYYIFGRNTISFSDPLVWIASYSIGLILLSRNNITYTSLLIIIAMGTTLNGILIYLNSYNVIEYGTRTSINLWGEIRGGTSSACSFLLYSAVLYSILKSKDVKRIIKIAWIVVALFVPLNAILISSRSALLYPFIIFAVSYMATLTYRNFIKRLIILAVIVLILFILYNYDVVGIKSYFESSFLYQRLDEQHDGGIIHNSRFDIWRKRLETITDNFWGGGITSYGTSIYMHNIILDTIVSGGLPTAILLVVFMLHSVYSVLYLYKRTYSNIEKSCLIGVLCAFLLIFMFEPIIQSSNWYFCLYLFFVGVIDQQKKNYKRNVFYALNR